MLEYVVVMFWGYQGTEGTVNDFAQCRVDVHRIAYGFGALFTGIH